MANDIAKARAEAAAAAKAAAEASAAATKSVTDLKTASVQAEKTRKELSGESDE